jgi:hypothetical protein
LQWAGIAVAVSIVTGLCVAVGLIFVALGFAVATMGVSVGIIMTSSLVTVGMSVCVADGVAATVLLTVGVIVVFTALEVENVVLMRIKNVIISPIPIGNMKLSGMACCRSSSRLGKLLRASGILRRRG